MRILLDKQVNKRKLALGLLVNILLGIFIMINNEGWIAVLAGIFWIIGFVLLVLFLYWLAPQLFR